MSKFSHQPNVFHSAEALFYPFSFNLADLVALGACRPFVQTATYRFSRHMGCDAPTSTTFYKFKCVTPLAGANRSSRPCSLFCQHGGASVPFLARSCFSDFRLHDEPVTVLSQNMTHVAEFRFFAFSLTEQLRFRVGAGLMCLFATLLSVEILAVTIFIAISHLA